MSASTQLIQIDLGPKLHAPKPAWLKAKAPVGDNFHNLKKLARGLGLHTVCESAQCPNIGECWHHHTATFMLLGDICTRRCGFCAVPKGRPEPIDWDEPRRVAEAVATLGLRHAVVTSVNRDDDNVGGARIFAETIHKIRQLVPECRVEVLIPDFQGLEEPLRIVLEAKPNVINHNTETADHHRRSEPDSRSAHAVSARPVVRQLQAGRPTERPLRVRHYEQPRDLPPDGHRGHRHRHLDEGAHTDGLPVDPLPQQLCAGDERLCAAGSVLPSVELIRVTGSVLRPLSVSKDKVTPIMSVQ